MKGSDGAGHLPPWDLWSNRMLAISATSSAQPAIIKVMSLAPAKSDRHDLLGSPSICWRGGVR